MVPLSTRKDRFSLSWQPPLTACPLVDGNASLCLLHCCRISFSKRHLYFSWVVYVTYWGKRKWVKTRGSLKELIPAIMLGHSMCFKGRLLGLVSPCLLNELVLFYQLAIFLIHFNYFHFSLCSGSGISKVCCWCFSFDGLFALCYFGMGAPR